MIGTYTWLKTFESYKYPDYIIISRKMQNEFLIQGVDIIFYLSYT